ncbi:MAG: flavin-containing monooxygenase, partial [Solirubrobacteraceae bacterium]
FHTARWEHGHDLAGRRIAFVGTGSTGAQVVPKLAEIAGHLYVYQRQPGWLLPKREREFTERERRRYARSGTVRAMARLGRFRDAGRLISALTIGTDDHERLKREALEYLRGTIQDPELRRALTPDYPFACKRIVLSRTYLPALSLPNVTLVPHAVERITRDGVVSADGVERAADVLVMGTGFTASSFLADLRVKGAGGRDLHETWGDEPRALAGTTVPGFPNFFILYGPNTNGGGSIIYQLERGAEVAVRAAKRLRRTGARAIDTSPAALCLYVRWIDRAVSRRLDAMSSGLCNNYFRAPSGRDVVSWPYSHLAFHATTRIVPRLAMRTTGAARRPLREPAAGGVSRRPDSVSTR